MPKFKAIIHGHAKGGMSSTYKSWKSMKDRCRRSKFYGKLGVRVCERWQIFANFLADMGERPNGTEIDRIDTRGNYEPNNCRWLLIRTNRQYKRTTVMTPEVRIKVSHMLYDGYTHKAISENLNINESTIQKFASGKTWL